MDIQNVGLEDEQFHGAASNGIIEVSAFQGTYPKSQESQTV